MTHYRAGAELAERAFVRELSYTDHVRRLARDRRNRQRTCLSRRQSFPLSGATVDRFSLASLLDA